jgi:opacity protein-like surface antigen
MKKTLAVLAMLLVCAASARAQRAHIGPHAGYNFDRNVGLAGGQISLPLSRYVELYPSVDVYFVDTGSLIGFNGDLKLRLQPGRPLQLYVGGGVNALRVHAGSTGNTDTGWDLLGGIETRLGYSHPYIEGKMLQHNGSTFQLMAGINITLF